MIDLILVTAALDATAQIYVQRPLASRLRAGTARLHLLQPGDPQPLLTRVRRRHADGLRGHVLAFLSRYAEPDAPALVEALRAAGVTVAALIDDDLFDPPANSALAALHGDPARQQRLRTVLQAADILYVPTAALAERLRARGIDTPAFVPALVAGLDPVPAALPSQPPCIGYMASRSHRDDLRLAADGLADCLRRYPEMRLELFGGIAAARDEAPLAAFADRITTLPAIGDHAQFLSALAGRGWTLGIAPLADTAFNRCKTAVKWLEYTACGIPVLASDMPVYAGLPGCRLVTDSGWAEALAALIDDASARTTLQRDAVTALRRDYPPARHAAELERFFAAAGIG